MKNKGFTPLQIFGKILMILKSLQKRLVSGRFVTGFTLIELLVSLSVFTLVVSASSGIFASSLRLQRLSIAYEQLLDQTSYLMEYMSRAVRMAKKDLSGACTGTAKLNYAFSGQCLKFRNYKDACQQFCLVNSAIKDEGGNYLTSTSSLSISAFSVTLSGQTQNDDIQPRVGIVLDVQGKGGSEIRIQTTVSQRNLDVKR